ncbi:hypothetical protein AVEN_243603-1 [Araneus ventricosus]|uniref:Uncharacterized protein n=1 Tax=Araneus ventricosus TaxID=182803 RepID=A0A4Y2A4F0_ARAVE|nr:hypothetical protein AVEN_243603-1 [Araneus ventricosus]
MNWRGVLAEPTIRHMTGWGYIRMKDIKILSIRALMGARIAWNMFSNMTEEAEERSGLSSTGLTCWYTTLFVLKYSACPVFVVEFKLKKNLKK